MVPAVERLVTQGPDDDRWVVLVTINHLTHSIDVGLAPGRVVGCPGSPITAKFAHAVTLEIAFIKDPEAKLISKIVEPGIVDVVRCPDGIYIVTFHQKKISFKKLVRHSSAMIWVVLMSVHASDDDGIAVDSQETIFDLHLAKTDTLSYDLLLTN
jgi:hypothetical protein